MSILGMNGWLSEYSLSRGINQLHNIARIKNFDLDFGYLILCIEKFIIE